MSGHQDRPRRDPVGDGHEHGGHQHSGHDRDEHEHGGREIEHGGHGHEGHSPHHHGHQARFCLRCGRGLTRRRVHGTVRPCCPDCGWIWFPDPKVGVGVLVVEDGRLLLVRRAMAPEQGRWALPGGWLDAGEDPAAVAVREAEEETGLEVAVDGLVDVFGPDPVGTATVFLLYRARVLTGYLRAGDDAAEVAFVGRDDLAAYRETLAFTSTRVAVERWLAGGWTAGGPAGPPDRS
jgi:ADP-ribose pyrophosphatase YjhB (NUDIX family)